MFAAMLVLALISVWAVSAAVVELRNDGYHRTPTVAH
jgi:hypothetical protein